MPNILFASNSVSHFPGSEVRSDSWSFDSARVPYSIFTPVETMVSTPQFSPSTSNETWFHFRVGSTYWGTNDSEPVFEIVDGEGTRIAYLSIRNNTSYGYQLYTATSTESEVDRKWIPVANSQMRTLDVHITHTALILRVDLYVNELLLLTREYSVASEIGSSFSSDGWSRTWSLLLRSYHF